MTFFKSVSYLNSMFRPVRSPTFQIEPKRARINHGSIASPYIQDAMICGILKLWLNCLGRGTCMIWKVIITGKNRLAAKSLLAVFWHCNRQPQREARRGSVANCDWSWCSIIWYNGTFFWLCSVQNLKVSSSHHQKGWLNKWVMNLWSDCK